MGRRNENHKWRNFVNSLTEKQKNVMLMALLEHQIEMLGSDGSVHFREADEDGPADIYWSSCGISLIEGCSP